MVLAHLRPRRQRPQVPALPPPALPSVLRSPRRFPPPARSCWRRQRTRLGTIENALPTNRGLPTLRELLAPHSPSHHAAPPHGSCPPRTDPRGSTKTSSPTLARPPDRIRPCTQPARIRSKHGSPRARPLAPLGAGPVMELRGDLSGQQNLRVFLPAQSVPIKGT